ncbi:Ldh family oxidoreductase [Aureimonas jatrophae]|uniref:Malate/lactate/ureidoglycolate dehydrogenase, LDH2 family n=1 Tax=Aureimonas jatrophae TaxID=1166073 RepID=A0A1H0HRT2_9HYPH|nr:Ldh family oxidoreductase [Aureimonas jatrophae]MBB3950737.1 LDH2 family malate/lactate/ureidoglycolate dehydrogenase [Aureimonas jatrophae]SDO21770.1 Malate/lactate/ureidoglycolate dehydrogenase, LDH2 family [Aureimonas jatrophae]
MNTIVIAADRLRQGLEEALGRTGASAESVAAARRAMMHASLLGVDSHGARLVAHYCQVLASGRVNPTPTLSVRRTGPSTAMVDGDNGLGHLVAYRAVEVAVDLARESGIGAVGATRSSHFGAAGAYARVIAEAGLVGFATTNSDSVVALFGGATPFHGTNPLAFAAPVGAGRPWLLDMATSSIPLNRVLLYRSLGSDLPEGVAADAAGQPTREAEAATMLLPLGGPGFGFKGAALAGVATLFAALLTGSTLDPDFIPMVGTADMSTPRGMGHFVLALDPDRFGGRDAFAAGIGAYLAMLRASPAADGSAPVLAPGDREWAVEAERLANGIPLDPDTAAFLGFG